MKDLEVLEEAEVVLVSEEYHLLSNEKVPSIHSKSISSNQNRNHVFGYCERKKKKYGNKFSVIDVGGSNNQWSSSVTDYIVDANDPPVDDKRHYFIINFKASLPNI